MDKEVIVSLYRMLHRGARKLDAVPAAKALLNMKPSKRYDFKRSLWVEISNGDEQPLQKASAKANPEAAEDYASEHLSNILGGGSLYRPQTSARQVLQNAFRAKVANEEERKVRIDAGFVAMRSMANVLAISDAILHKKSMRKTSAMKAAENPLFCKTTGDLESGLVLVAHPLMDGIFCRKLVLLYDYNQERGACGLVINGPVIAEINLDNLLNSKATFHGEPVRVQDIYFGGPVTSRNQKNFAGRRGPVRVNVLHTHGDLRGAHQVAPGLYANFKREDALEKYMEGELKAADLMILQGYCGWGRNQLEGELGQNKWFASNVDNVPQLIRDRLAGEASNALETEEQGFLDADLQTHVEEEQWEKVLKGLGGEYADLWRIPRIRESDG